MRVTSVNEKKYILVIFNDYSRFTWVKCLRIKDEAPDFIINFLKMIQVRLKETVQRIRTDNGTEFVNQTLREYYGKVGISHEISVARSPQQNDVVERRNHTLIKAARTMLIYAKAFFFYGNEALLHRPVIDPKSFHDTLRTRSSGPHFNEMTVLQQSVQDSWPNPIVQHLCYTFRELTRICCFNRCSMNFSILHLVLIIPATKVDQDAPSSSNSQTTPETKPPVIPNDVEEDNHDIEVAYMGNDLYFSVNSRKPL
ncbi:retrovirus-related pol polyprotein from transposon TNT 1-94 [Tanacetum coccineum]